GAMVDYGVNPSYDPNARERRLREQESINQEIETKRTEALRDVSNCRILSLSRTPDNMVMWAHYASNSQGLCIGIDWVKASLLAPMCTQSNGAFKPTSLTVEYREHPFRSRFDRNDNYVLYALGRKHVDWAYEREIRILRHASDFEHYGSEST